MLTVCRTVAKRDTPDVWIHAAAVLDYFTEPETGKKPSGADEWVLKLKPGKKHIRELQGLVNESYRIGFKLETNVDESTLINKAKHQIQTYGVDAVVANIFEEMNEPDSLRARIVHSDGRVERITNDRDLAKSICMLIDNN